MKYCLVKDDYAVESDCIYELTHLATKWALDYDKRTVQTKEFGLDTISYSEQFTDQEFRMQAAEHVLKLLLRDGWRFYKAA